MSGNTRRLRVNSLLFRLIISYILSTLLVFIATLTIVLWEMNNRYINSFSRSTAQIIEKSNYELRVTGDAIIKLISTLRSSRTLRDYIKDQDKTTAQSSYITYSLVNTVESLLPNGQGSKLNVLVAGTNNVMYSTVGTTPAIPLKNLFESEFTSSAKNDTSTIHYEFFPKGFTVSTTGQSVFVASAAVMQADGVEPIAFIYVIITQEQLRDYYRELSTDDNTIILLNESGTIISSLKDGNIGQIESRLLYDATNSQTDSKPFFRTVVNGRNVVGVSRSVKYWGLQIVGIIDSLRSPELGNTARFVLLSSTLVAGIIVIIILIIFNKTMRPLKSLASHMSRIRSGNFNEPLPAASQWEIRELTSAYNYMLDDIRNYVEQLKEAEGLKRNAEIRALQAQINPHFIYNTLASVKWLIWSCEDKKALMAIDSFTNLMKSTIGNKSEMISVRDEIENLKNYVVLQQIRFGEQIKVVFSISDNCLDAMIPKMIIQPFIENAFFHAYPDEEKGIISLFISRLEQTLVVEIIDYGVGIDNGEYERKINSADIKKDQYNGIGIANVDERVRLLFGNEYNVTVTSESGKGTNIRITLPFIEKDMPYQSK